MTTFNPKLLKYMCEDDGIFFMRYFFKIREGNKLLLNWHHIIIEMVLQAVIDGKIKRLLINIAPGYTKTELAIINFVARGLAINPRAKFIQTSYSEKLVNENSSKIKDTVTLKEYKDLWPMVIRKDKNAKGLWFNEEGGGLLCASSSSQITGFRAGRMEEGFTGAFLIDDPLKPEDAYSEVRRVAINNRFNNSFRSRLAVESVPMVCIMQSLHEDDLSNFLLSGGSGDYWHHLCIPTILDKNVIEYHNEKHTHKIPIDINKMLQQLNGGLEYEF